MRTYSNGTAGHRASLALFVIDSFTLTISELLCVKLFMGKQVSFPYE